MKTANHQKSQNQPVKTSTDSKNQDFDFDLWAVQVKQQMLDALNRRGLR